MRNSRCVDSSSPRTSGGSGRWVFGNPALALIWRVVMATRVGFIGLGNMGKPIAINLAKAGFDLMVYDLRREPMQELAALGAKCASSAHEIGKHAEIVELVVVDDAQVEAV